MTRRDIHHRLLSRIRTQIKIQTKRLNEMNALLHLIQNWRLVWKKETLRVETLGSVRQCCGSDLNEPYQPGFDYALTRKKQGKQTRSFLSSWFREHKWLTFCITRKKALCFYCHKAYSKGLITFSKKGDTTFITKGFDNWKKAKERFSAHKKTQIHKEAYFKCNAVHHL